MIDTVIVGGDVVTEDGVNKLDIAIQGEKIVATAIPGTLPVEGVQTIDAGGKLVIPGGIDPHHHTHHGVVGPGRDTGEWSLGGQDPEHTSRAALFGGVTTLVDFAIWGTTPDGDFSKWQPDQTMSEAISAKEEFWAKAYCDYGLHVTLRRSVPTHVIEEIPEIISAGFPSIKIFTTDVKPNRRHRKMDFGHLWEVAKQVARHEGILMVHAEDDEIVMYQHDTLEREGRIGIENIPLVHHIVSEDVSFRRIMALARHVEGSALYMAHVSAKVGVDAIAEMRAAGYPVYGETLPHYTVFSADSYKEPDGALYHTSPGLKYAEDIERLWSGLRDGSLNTMATDELCAPRAVKLQGKTVFDVIGGYVGVETLLPIVYTEGVHKRGLPLERFVAITSANAAKILGFYPQKGVIAPGSDADIVIFDPSARRKLRAVDLHESDYTLWEGWEVNGSPILTMLRGQVVVEQGEFRGIEGQGRRVPRKLMSSVLSHPVVV